MSGCYVKPGLEVLLEQEMALVRGKRVGLVANHTAVTGDLVHAVDALSSVGVNLAALFAPEHGIRGDIAGGQEVQSGVDPRTGIQVHSLYGPVKKPTPQMLAGIDILLFDIQDIGSRFYTYISTMFCCLQACAETGRRFVVLDRPNPINGLAVEGNIPDRGFGSFLGMYPLPIRHGMTVGELALCFNGEQTIGADLEVVTCKGWKRLMYFDQTGFPWVMPSPNMPTPETAILYPGLCFLEGTNVSEGRGAAKPFEVAGAPWADGYDLAYNLNSLELPGVRFRPVSFVPTTSKYEKQPCAGIQVHITDRNAVRPVEVGLHVVKAFRDLYPASFQFRPPGTSGKHFFDLLAGTDKIRLALDTGHFDPSTSSGQARLRAGMLIDEIVESWRHALRDFMGTRAKYLLYS